jgi:ketosteroid isomerase-like protein
MTNARTPEDVVRAVGRGVGRLVTGGLTEQEREQVLDELAGLYGEETDVRHPFALFGDTPLRTRAELRRHFAEGAGRTPAVESFAPADVVVHRTADPEVVVEEFRYEGRVNGRPFSLPCIFVVRVRDGVIVESRDYTNPVGLARAFGRVGEVAAALADSATGD